MQKAIDNGTPEFKSYAEVIIEAMPEVTLPVLREMFKYNATVREYLDYIEHIEGRIK